MATTYDNASLVMIPSGVKEDKLYSIKPTDGSGDFTFSRGSDIQATRVNSSGLIEKAKVNLLPYSNSFSNANWTKSNISVTGGQSGYDGSNDAWQVSVTSASYYMAENLVTSDVQTFSVYAKAGTLNWLMLGIGGGTFTEASFDLQNGVLGSTSNAIDSNIESVGSGWYRCSIIFNKTTSNRVIYPAIADSDLTASSGYIYIQDSQVNHGLVAQDYVETTTTAVVEGLTADLPRLDYSGGASCPSLLLEPSRTNLFIQSEYFGSTPYTRANSSVTHNDLLSPEGVVNGAKLESTSNDSASRLDSFPTLSDNTIYTASAFFKKGNVNHCFIGIRGKDGVATSVYFDLENGTKGTENNSPIDADIEQYGDWYRCYVVQNVNSGATAPRIQLAVAAADNDFLTANGEYNYIYGAVLEAGSYPTSYIPTYGTAAVRGADSASKTGISSLIGQTEGTLFVELDATGQTAVSGRGIAYLTQNGLTSNRVAIQYDASGQLQGIASSGGSTQGSVTYAATGNSKAAITYDSSGYEFFVNGASRGTFAGSLPVALEQVDLGSVGQFNAVGEMNGGIDQVLVFQTKLTDAECIALTTL